MLDIVLLYCVCCRDLLRTIHKSSVSTWTDSIVWHAGTPIRLKRVGRGTHEIILRPPRDPLGLLVAPGADEVSSPRRRESATHTMYARACVWHSLASDTACSHSSGRGGAMAHGAMARWRDGVLRRSRPTCTKK